MSIENCGNSWQFLATFDSLWQFLKTFGNFWQPVATFDNLWQPLSTYVNFFQLLATVATFDSFWQLLATFGNSWQRLATWGNLWDLGTHFRPKCFFIVVWWYKTGSKTIFEEKNDFEAPNCTLVDLVILRGWNGAKKRKIFNWLKTHPKVLNA